MTLDATGATAPIPVQADFFRSLEILQTPIWLLGTTPARLLWANPAALLETGLNDLDSLRRHADGASVAAALAAQLGTLQAAQDRSAVMPPRWSLPLPDGEVQQFCQVRALRLEDGETALLLEALPEMVSLGPGGESSPYGFFVHDALRPVYVNQTLLRLLGHDSAGAVLELDSVLELYAPAERERLRTLAERRLRGETLDNCYETLLQRADGSTLAVQQTANPMTWRGRRCVQVTVMDISGYRETLEALQKSETLLAEAERIARLGSWQLDAATRDLSYSREAFRIYGLDPDRPAPTFEEHQALIHPEDRDLWLRTIEESVRRGKHFEIQFRNVLPDGSFRILESRGQCHSSPDGRVSRLRGTVQDITERKRMEKIKDEFVSTVSHELRTPLTSIRGSLGLVTGSMAGELPDRAASLLRIAYKNCERLVNLVNDILDMAKIESGSMEYKFRPLDLVTLIEQAIEANRPFAQQFEVRLDFSQRPEEAVVFGDNDRLMQVLANLLANAVKFSPAGTEVRISLGRYQGMLRVSVADRGPGIPDQYREKVFEKFGQVDSSDVRQKGGTGLGLAIVQAIVKKHWGFINFESAQGEGTAFHVDLPEYHQRKTLQRSGPASPAGIPARAASASDERDGQHRLLVVEDDHDTAALLQEMLEREGYYIDVAHSAREALQLVNSHRYVATTVDLLLPDQDGISLIRSIRAHPQGQTLPIIVVSLSAELGRENLNGEALGIIDWLSKPVDNRRLLKAINQAMRNLDQGQARILHVEDDTDVLRVVAAVLGRAAEVETATTLQEARHKLTESRFDLVIIDIGLPDGSGLALLDLIKDCRPRPPVLVFSAQDCDSHVAQEISTVLVKSRTTNRQLCNTIKMLIQR